VAQDRNRPHVYGLALPHIWGAVAAANCRRRPRHRELVGRTIARVWRRSRRFGGAPLQRMQSNGQAFQRAREARVLPG